MIPISDCGNDPPEGVGNSGKLVIIQDEFFYEGADMGEFYSRTDEGVRPYTSYNFGMRWVIAGLMLLCLPGQVHTQDKTAAGARVVTVPATIDHNRVVIRGDFRLADGSTQTVRVWVDNGNPDLNLSRRLATLLSLPVKCG